ncbi:MAG: hypothetical protein ATN35_06085 [Epulopiscium sp. Nele67-Bin004]|nr:MAG: hypothetical protein ATN35_06085 [Epulopiscium sp. Nele67-Bin004]
MIQMMASKPRKKDFKRFIKLTIMEEEIANIVKNSESTKKLKFKNAHLTCEYMKAENPKDSTINIVSEIYFEDENRQVVQENFVTDIKSAKYTCKSLEEIRQKHKIEFDVTREHLTP